MRKLYILTENKILEIEEWILIGEFNYIQQKNDRTIFSLEESNNDIKMSNKLISEVSIPSSRIYKFE
jgi:hypothetical protein